MKLAFSTLGCPEWKFDDILSAAHDLGYDGVEIRGMGDQLYAPAIPQFQPENIENTKAALKRLNLEIPCLTSACELQKPSDKLYLECKGYIDTAAALGVPYIRVLGDTGPKEQDAVDPVRVVDAAQLLGAYAKEKGVTLLIESNGYFANTERLAKVLEQVNSTGVAALWDIHHPYRFANEPPKVTMDNIGKYVRHVHVKDSVEVDGGVKYKMMGYGDLPVAECLDRLHEVGFDGYCSLEWIRRWEPSLEEPGIAFALYVGYMKKLMW